MKERVGVGEEMRRVGYWGGDVGRKKERREVLLEDT